MTAQTEAPTTVRSPGNDTALRIREVALELFGRQGYERTSLREISDRLGVTKAALYYHYRTKDDILLALVDPIAADLESLCCFEGERAAPSLEGQRRFLAAYLDVLLRHRRVITYLVNDSASLWASPVGPRIKDLELRLHAHLGCAEAPLSARVRGLAAVGALKAGIIGFPEVSDEELRGPLLQAAEEAMGL